MVLNSLVYIALVIIVIIVIILLLRFLFSAIFIMPITLENDFVMQLSSPIHSPTWPCSFKKYASAEYGYLI